MTPDERVEYANYIEDMLSLVSDDHIETLHLVNDDHIEALHRLVDDLRGHRDQIKVSLNKDQWQWVLDEIATGIALSKEEPICDTFWAETILVTLEKQTLLEGVPGGKKDDGDSDE